MKEVIYINLAKGKIETDIITRRRMIPPLQVILHHMAEGFNVDYNELVSNKRPTRLIEIKRVVNFVLAPTGLWSNSYLGTKMGHDHSWVYYHLRKMYGFLQIQAERRKYIPMIHKAQEIFDKVTV